MKSKQFYMGMAAAALDMVGRFTPTAVDTVQSLNEISEVTAIQQAQGQRAQTNQGQQQGVTQKVGTQIVRNYLPYSDRGGTKRYRQSPKEYGLYLARTGKNKIHNRRRNKWRKMRS